jgi:hypothetical protein
MIDGGMLYSDTASLLALEFKIEGIALTAY